MNQDRLARLLHAFFEDHLKCQKGLQTTSIRSYRDALRLFLLFVADDLHRKLTQIVTTRPLTTAPAPSLR